MSDLHNGWHMQKEKTEKEKMEKSAVTYIAVVVPKKLIWFARMFVRLLNNLDFFRFWI
ncbi:MAG: hypothetical protein AAFZ15_27270 [Bacteroidota bacterium]